MIHTAEPSVHAIDQSTPIAKPYTEHNFSMREQRTHSAPQAHMQGVLYVPVYVRTEHSALYTPTNMHAEHASSDTHIEGAFVLFFQYLL